MRQQPATKLREERDAIADAFVRLVEERDELRAVIERLRAAHEQVARDCFKIANDDTIPESVRQSCLTIGRLAVKAYNGEQAGHDK